LTNEFAISRLKNRSRWLEKKIVENTASGQPTFWYEQDRDALAIGVAAIEYVIATQEYEQSQQ
jgi:hypothetical protein